MASQRQHAGAPNAHEMQKSPVRVKPQCRRHTHTRTYTYTHQIRVRDILALPKATEAKRGGCHTQHRAQRHRDNEEVALDTTLRARHRARWESVAHDVMVQRRQAVSEHATTTGHVTRPRERS